MTAGERCCSAVIAFLARDLGRAQYLQQVHVDDGTGCCAGCRSQTSWIAHPCLLRQLADETFARLIPLQRGHRDRQ